MTYVTTTTVGTARVQRIVPQSSRIVMLRMSAVLAGYKTALNDEMLSLYTDLALSGTTTRSKADIAEYLDRHGIELSVSVSYDTITFTARVLDTKLPQAREILTDVLTHFTVAKKEFDVAKGHARESIREAHDDAKLRARIAFLEVMYPKGHFYRMESLEQSKHSVEALSMASIRAAHAALLKATWSISVVGTEKALKSLTPLFARVCTGPENTRVVPALVPARAHNVFIPVAGKTNVEVLIGHSLPLTLNDAEYPALNFGLAVLGKVGGFSGRLMSIVREKEGLTYGIYARLEGLTATEAGFFNIYTFFTAKDLEQGVTSTLREVKTIVENGITDTELRTFKEILKNQFAIAHESNARRMSLYHSLMLQGWNETAMNDYMQNIESLTKKGVNDALRKHIHPDALTTAGAGPVTKAGKGVVNAK